MKNNIVIKKDYNHVRPFFDSCDKKSLTWESYFFTLETKRTNPLYPKKEEEDAEI
jgi:hypothetical protein